MEDEELVEGPYIPQIPEGVARANAEHLIRTYRVVNRGVAAPMTASTSISIAGVNPVTFEEVGSSKHSLAKPEDIDEMFS